MDIFINIAPVFVVIAIGWIACQRGFIPDEFLGPANRLVYYLAIPAMIFHSISKGSLSRDFDGRVMAVTLATLVLFFLLVWGAGRLTRMKSAHAATFIQGSFHGNLGYIGLAVAFYFLGERGLASAGILAGFLMILQNFLSVFILQHYGGIETGKRRFSMARRILGNPVIIAALAGIFFSALEIPLHPIFSHTLGIISGMALPLALLLIGGSLSIHLIRSRFLMTFASVFLKLLVLPGLGFFLYRLLGIPPAEYLPGLILLASPTATIVYVMAGEMDGDMELAVAVISASTLASALTFMFWLSLAG